MTDIKATTNSMDPHAFATAVNDHHFTLKDYVADPRDIRLFTDQAGSILTLKGVGETEPASGDFVEHTLPMQAWAHTQLAEFCGIPASYYKAMQASQHGLLDNNVNTWMDHLTGKARMIRTVNGQVRAVLSNRYRRIDNYHVANTVLPVLIEAGATFRRMHVTQDHMVIQAVFTQKTADVRVGDTIMLGVTIENNEVGRGCVSVLPMSLRLTCMNGATHNNLGHKRQHVGTKLGGDGDPSEFYADDTLKASDEALMLQLRDVTRKACSDTLLETITADFQRALGVPITAQPTHAVTELAQRVGLNESEQSGVLQHLLAGGTLNQYAMVQAITRTAQDVEDGLRGHELEKIGGDILAMAAAEFGPIAKAGEPRTRKRSR